MWRVCRSRCDGPRASSRAACLYGDSTRGPIPIPDPETLSQRPLQGFLAEFPWDFGLTSLFFQLFPPLFFADVIFFPELFFNPFERGSSYRSKKYRQVRSFFGFLSKSPLDFLWGTHGTMRTPQKRGGEISFSENFPGADVWVDVCVPKSVQKMSKSFQKNFKSRKKFPPPFRAQNWLKT